MMPTAQKISANPRTEIADPYDGKYRDREESDLATTLKLDDTRLDKNETQISVIKDSSRSAG